MKCKDCRCGVVFKTLTNKAWTEYLCRFKSCSQLFEGLERRKVLTMIPTGNKLTQLTFATCSKHGTKVNIRNTKKRSEIHSKLTIKTIERRH